MQLPVVARRFTGGPRARPELSRSGPACRSGRRVFEDKRALTGVRLDCIPSLALSAKRVCSPACTAGSAKGEGGKPSDLSCALCM